ncbi:hypothetical protein DesfrDRAFT_0897 [Solidesulfovibrio fructosivorans JJ]]|uniref:Uncharacterized protein n=1 Tax=Solidesulfovibrio fructosivorans JJ] TaxID=596151 RepID=E1JTE8_SOLFR|nr:hypothetical protein DesfrDRAFT_0897 [Solidesulfovibrio fructosivorans JJ]]
MKRLFVMITTKNPDKATRAAQFAKLAGESLAGMMLVDDGVYLAIPETLDRTKAVTGDDFVGHLAALPRSPCSCANPAARPGASPPRTYTRPSGSAPAWTPWPSSSRTTSPR